MDDRVKMQIVVVVVVARGVETRARAGAKELSVYSLTNLESKMFPSVQLKCPEDKKFKRRRDHKRAVRGI